MNFEFTKRRSLKIAEFGSELENTYSEFLYEREEIGFKFVEM